MLKQTVIRSGLESLYFSGASWALRGVFGGLGAILTLHHVRPPRQGEFQPNRLLEITPEFLQEVIVRLQGAGMECVSLDEMQRRVTEGETGRRFVCFTFDDGYRDNLGHAYPILRAHKVPFTIFLPSSFPDGFGNLWWLTLERVVARNGQIALDMHGTSRRFACDTPEGKRQAFDEIYWWLRSLPTEEAVRQEVRSLAVRYGVEPATSAELCMTWSELAEMAADPLVTIGAHTVNHVMLAKLPTDAARREMESSAQRIEAALGTRPQHFSYPVGDPTSAGPREFAIAKELGFKTAVTTRPGVLFADHREHMMALPRISLNGEFQRMRYVKVLTSGAATALWNGFKRVDAA